MAKKAKNRRARGTGSIFYSDSRKLWVGRRTIGVNSHGNPIRQEVTGETQAEVIRKLDRLAPPGPSVTVSEFADRWIEGLSIKPGTRRNYTGVLNTHLIPAIGTVRIADLTTGRIESFINGLVAKGMNPTSARRVFSQIRSMLFFAVRCGVITQNPAKGTRLPKGKTKKIDPFTVAEMQRIIQSIGDLSPEKAGLLATLTGTGCRLGEAIGLNVEDCDVKTGTISIVRTYSRLHGEGSPKSANSIRTIGVASAAWPLVLTALGNRSSGPAFTLDGKRRILDVTVRRDWRLLLKRLGIPQRNVHQIRHSVATHLIAAGESLGDVAAYLGDTVPTVVNTYLHPTKTDPRQRLNILYGESKV